MSFTTRAMTFLGVGTLAIFGLGACATVSPGSRPDDMSAAEHRATAEQYEAKAAENQALYDPNAISGVEGDMAYRRYNPTDIYLQHAAKFREHARQHAEAAKVLEDFEDANCGKIRKDVRSVCPLVGGVVDRVVDIDNGVRLFVADENDTEAVAAHMKCHYAFGRAHGHKGMDTCPLYLKDLTIKVSGKNSVDIVAEDPNVVAAVRERSKELVSGNN